MIFPVKADRRRGTKTDIGRSRRDGGHTRPMDSLLTDQDLYLFNEGSHFRLYQKLGAHLLDTSSGVGTYFAVWAPSAQRVSVIGDFNGWNRASHPLRSRDRSGIWEGFFPGVGSGSPTGCSSGLG